MGKVVQRALVVVAVAALFQACLPLLLCLLRGVGPSFIIVPWLEPEDSRPVTSPKYFRELWRFRDATAFSAALGLVAGASAFAESMTVRRRRMLLIPPAVAVLVVPNFVYVAMLAETGSFREALRHARWVFLSDRLIVDHMRLVELPFIDIWYLVVAYVLLLQADSILRWLLDEMGAQLILAGFAFFATWSIFGWRQGLVAATCAAGLGAGRALARAVERHRSGPRYRSHRIVGSWELEEPWASSGESSSSPASSASSSSRRSISSKLA